jgi:tetratricopeptide (TPR) repeat protein
MICQYLYEEFEPDVVRKMIFLYGQNASTEEILRRELSLTVPEFEQRVAERIFAAAREQRIAPQFLPGDGELIERLLSERPQDALLKVAQARLLAEEALRRRDTGKTPAFQEELDRAAQIVIEVTEKDSQARGAYATLAGIHLFREQYTEALDAAQKALVADEKDFLARRYLGLTHLRMNEPREAVVELEKAAELYPRAAEIWVTLHALYTKEKDDAGSIRALQGRLRANPRDVPAIKALGTARLTNGEYGKAVDILGKGLRYSLYDGELYRLLVDAYEGMGKWKTARRYAEFAAATAGWRAAN